MVFAGLNCLLDKKYLFAAGWAVLAAYLHILVGGWFFFLVIIFTLFATKNITIVLKQVLVFSLLIAPYAFYLAREVFSSGSVIQGVNIDWVYVFFRNPHHTAPLSVHKHLLRTSIQVAATALVFGLTLFVFSKKKGPVFDDLYRLNVIILTVLFVSLAISLIDHQGVFLKFYPFRLAAMGLLLMYLYIYKLVAAKWQSPVLVKFILILFGFYLITAASGKTISGFIHPTVNPSYEALVDFVSRQTDPDEIFLTLKDYDLSFSRRTRREVFINLKCDPGGGRKVYEWYYRIREREKLVHDIGYIEQILKNYRIDYVLSDHLLPPCKRLSIAFQNPDYYLYKIQ